MPLKIKYFLWLEFENCLNNWDNLIHRGWMGPNMCALCREDNETVEQLFVKCKFTKNVWKNFCDVLNISHTWGGQSFGQNFLKWFNNCSMHNTLLGFISWRVRKEINNILFELKYVFFCM